MPNPSQEELLKRSVGEWNMWRMVHPDTIPNLNGAVLSRFDLKGADLEGTDLTFSILVETDLSNANLRSADLGSADLSGTNLSVAFAHTGGSVFGVPFGANLSGADLSGANLSGANLTGANLRGAKRGAPPPDTTNWLSLVETVGTNLLVTAATLAAIIQGLDVIERRWREHQAKHQRQGTQTAPPSSQKTPVSDKEIVEILLVMDDGSHHTSQRWISDPDILREHIDVFSDPTSKVKPLQVVFRKRKGRALVVDVTEGGKDNPQLNFVIRSYLEADPQ